MRPALPHLPSGRGSWKLGTSQGRPRPHIGQRVYEVGLGWDPPGGKRHQEAKWRIPAQVCGAAGPGTPNCPHTPSWGFVLRVRPPPEGAQ